MNPDITLPVAEQFMSIQGEGPTAGKPALFLRLGYCNLKCGNPDDPDHPQEEMETEDDATWLCDTIETYRNPEPVNATDLIDEWVLNGHLGSLNDGTANLILTGGEPMLHQDKLGRLLKEHERISVEVETNGTISPKTPFDDYVNHYNVSVKLSNSGMAESRRIVPEPINRFAADPRATFKFVVSRDQDIDEIKDLARRFGIAPSDIMLMPAGASRDDLLDNYPEVMDLCQEHGYQFSPRLQVSGYDEATGV